MPSTKRDYCSHPDCLRKDEMQTIKGRGLCRACYNKAYRQGWLHSWVVPASASTADQALQDPPPDMTTKSNPESVTVPKPVQEAYPSQPLSSPAAQASRPAALRPPRKPVKKPVDLRVNVDFGAAAHVLEEIRVRADREMRPLALQILWELKRALAGEDAA